MSHVVIGLLSSCTLFLLQGLVDQSAGTNTVTSLKSS